MPSVTKVNRAGDALRNFMGSEDLVSSEEFDRFLAARDTLEAWACSTRTTAPDGHNGFAIRRTKWHAGPLNQ